MDSYLNIDFDLLDPKTRPIHWAKPILRRHGVRVADAARALHLTPAYLSNLLNGHSPVNNLNERKLKALADYLESRPKS